MMTSYNFEHMRLEELTNLFESDSFAEEDEAYMGDVAHAIVRFGDTGVAYLSDVLSSGDDVHQRWALFGLGYGPDREETVRLMLSYLNDRCPLLVSEAIDRLIAVGHKSGWKEISPLLSHSSEYVRGAVMRYACYALSEEEAFAVLTDGLNDPHFIVVENAIDELDDLGKPEAIPYIEKHVGHPHPHVRAAAKGALDYLKRKSEKKKRS